jgi:hypothetical protein
VCFLLCTRTRLVGFLVLVHWNNSTQVDMSPYSNTLFWLRANQFLLLHLNAAYLAEKQQIPILESLVWPDLGPNPWSNALKANSLTITPCCESVRRPIQTHYPDSEPTSLCSYSLMLLAQRRSSKYQFYSPLFDATEALTYNLPHSSKH